MKNDGRQHKGFGFRKDLFGQKVKRSFITVFAVRSFVMDEGMDVFLPVPRHQGLLAVRADAAAVSAPGNIVYIYCPAVFHGILHQIA